MQIWQKNRFFFQIQDGGRTPYWKPFLAISRSHIGRFMQISEWGWSITCRYRSLDQNGNFRKFKIADGRHFENRFVSISQPRIIRFRSNFVRRCKFPFPGWLFDKTSKFFKFKTADGRHIENRFLAISWRVIGRSTRNSEKRWRITCQYRSRDQNCNFPQFKMAEGCHFEKFSVFTSFF